MYKNFVELLEAYPVASNKKVAAICAHEDHVIEAMIDVHQRYDVQPILIGHEDEIRMLLAALGVPCVSGIDLKAEAATALLLVFLLRKILPFSYEAMLVGTAVALSVTSLIFAFRYGKR